MSEIGALPMASAGGSALGDGTTLFDLSVVIKLRAEDFNKALKELSGSMENTANKLGDNAEKAGKSGKSLLDTLEQGMKSLATTIENVLYWIDRLNLVDVGKELVAVAEEVEEEKRLFSAVFGEVEEDATSAMKTMADETHIHFGRLRSGFTQMQEQFISAGFSAEEAMQMTVRGMQLVADVSAVWGISLDDATNRVMSFTRGNYEAGESIGLIASEVEREAYATELYGRAWEELSEKEREYALMEISYDAYESSGYLGMSKENTGSINDAMNNIRSAWREIQYTLGKPIADAVTPVLQNLAEWLEENEELVEIFADAIGDLAEAISNLIIEFLKNPDWINNIMGGLEWLFGFLGVIEPEVQFEQKGGVDDVTDFVGLTKAEGAERWNYAYGWIQAFEDLKREQNDGDFLDVWNEWAAEGRLNSARATAFQYLSADEYSAVENYLSERTINPDTGRPYKYREGVYTEGAEAFLDETFGDLDALPEEIKEGAKEGAKEGVVAGMAGMSFTITMDNVAVGHLVAPTVMGDMARSVRNSKFSVGANV